MVVTSVVKSSISPPVSILGAPVDILCASKCRGGSPRWSCAVQYLGEFIGDQARMRLGE